MDYETLYLLLLYCVFNEYYSNAHQFSAIERISKIICFTIKYKNIILTPSQMPELLS